MGDIKKKKYIIEIGNTRFEVRMTPIEYLLFRELRNDITLKLVESRQVINSLESIGFPIVELE